jgi:hypothetical protein
LTPIALDKQTFHIPSAPHVGMISYDSLPFDVTSRAGMTLIADEAHYLKSARARRTQIFRLLSARVQKLLGRVWLLTGTPLLNRPQELWAILHAADLAYKCFGSWEHFVELFGGVPAGKKGKWETQECEECKGRGLVNVVEPLCLRGKHSELAPGAWCGECKWRKPVDQALMGGPEPCKTCKGKGERKVFVEDPEGTAGSQGYVWTMASPEVGRRLQTVMLRRKRADVLPDLPVKTWGILPAVLSKSALKECAAFSDLFREGETSEELYKRLSEQATFERISALMEKLSVAKIPSLLEHVSQFEEEEEPLVVFSAHRRPIEALAGRKGWTTILGDDSASSRASKVSGFMAGKYLGIAGTIGALGTSVTLTRARVCLFVSRRWTPAENAQAEDRVCRIGQDRGVLIYDLVSPHALDVRVSEVLAEKTRLVASVL